jgi:hypothetical protein
MVSTRSATRRRPALRCDIDHTIAFADGGRTHASNLKCLCRLHHGDAQCGRPPCSCSVLPLPGLHGPLLRDQIDGDVQPFQCLARFVKQLAVARFVVAVAKAGRPARSECISANRYHHLFRVFRTRATILPA